MSTKLNINAIENGSITVDKLSDDVFNSVGNGMISITYQELKNKRDSSELSVGSYYRITDYVTTTSQENTSSAGHQFDVIVLALSNNKLSEEAKACLHDGDTYFTSANAKLEAWRLWYCLDNDTDRFTWADTENGKGVIYRMIDEGRNDLPYDFKNIMFRRYKLNAPESVDSEPYIAKMSENIQAQFSAGTLSYIWGGFYADEDRYWEYNWWELYSTITGEYMDFYTFSDVINGVVSDISLDITRCYDNVMGRYRRLKKLNNNVFFSDKNNYQFYLNSFGIECYDNSFVGTCYDNSFGYDFSENTFGDECSNNSFGNNCDNNSFGINCNNNSFVENCDYNSFGKSCYYISFGLRCSKNLFGNGCRYINLVSSGGPSTSGIQNYKIAQGLRGDYFTPITITAESGREYETKVAKNSAGEIKIYCEADLIP